MPPRAAGRPHARRVHRAGPEDDVAELRGIGEPAQGVDGELELLSPGDRLLPDLAGGDLQVLLGDGDDHIGGAHGERRELVRIEPDAEAVVALAEVGDPGDPGEPAQLVADVDRRVVA